MTQRDERRIDDMYHDLCEAIDRARSAEAAISRVRDMIEDLEQEVSYDPEMGAEFYDGYVAATREIAEDLHYALDGAKSKS